MSDLTFTPDPSPRFITFCCLEWEDGSAKAPQDSVATLLAQAPGLWIANATAYFSTSCPTRDPITFQVTRDDFAIVEWKGVVEPGGATITAPMLRQEEVERATVQTPVEFGVKIVWNGDGDVTVRKESFLQISRVEQVGLPTATCLSPG